MASWRQPRTRREGAPASNRESGMVTVARKTKNRGNNLISRRYASRLCTLRQIAESSSTGIDLPLDVEVEFDSLRFPLFLVLFFFSVEAKC